ncbi:hypothetical protein CLPU_15c00510 [Gottschalkia purinilytica]|uniref:Uncharacterized protein n=1 Tax=Gottschalkia purinilytica TaxID=1503 RepID=A0A0L0W7Z7_GOTPU|nr:hypothetical protein [Gottschalkia purinilytica]KNF07557.1 hypothetical protein CLPU_15c00510 [Gottschalkia purinilytica]
MKLIVGPKDVRNKICLIRLICRERCGSVCLIDMIEPCENFW